MSGSFLCLGSTLPIDFHEMLVVGHTADDRFFKKWVFAASVVIRAVGLAGF